MKRKGKAPPLSFAALKLQQTTIFTQQQIDMRHCFGGGPLFGEIF
jgi:hypothetical protein